MRIMSLYLNSEIVNSEIVHLYSLDQTVFFFCTSTCYTCSIEMSMFFLN